MSSDALIATVAAVALAAISLYAVFGGADFGGGVWDVLATGPRRNVQRETIGHAIGPVWETNHVWLIFAIVILFTCFPPAFAALGTGLYVPLSFALVGIILRGAAYAFRSSANVESRMSQFWGHVFGIASIVTPFFFGASVGGLTLGGFAWASPFALCLGLLAIALCAQIAAIFLTCEARGALQGDFRVRAIGATFALAALGAAALAIAHAAAPEVFARLVRPASLPGIGAAMLLGFVVLALLWARRYVLARIAVAVEAVAVLAGWYLSQAPDLIPGTLSYVDAASPPATLRAFLVLTGLGAVVLIPSLLLLFRVFKSEPATNH